MDHKCNKDGVVDKIDKHEVEGYGHLPLCSSPIIPLCFDNIPRSPCRATLWHSPASQMQRSLLLLVMPHKLNLHTEKFCWDVPDAKIWINMKAPKAAMCLYASVENQRKYFRPNLTCIATVLLFKANL